MDFVVEEDDIVVEGRRWHLYSAGPTEGPTVVLVHGFRSSGRFLRGAISYLADPWRCHAPDLPGHGDSEPWDPEEDVVEQWVLLEGFLDALSLAQVALVGVSRGAAVALQMAAHRPDRVVALVMVAVPMYPFTPGTLDLRRMVADPSVLTEEMLRDLGRTVMASRGYETARRRAVERGTLERDLRPILGKVRAPTLIMWGSEDRTIPVEMGMVAQAGIEGATLHLIGGSGHVPFLERPGSSLPLVRGFLEERAGPGT